MSKQNYAVCCYTCEHNGQETCKGCSTILNGENEPYENWQLREDLCQKDEQIADLQHRLEVAEIALELACNIFAENDKAYKAKTKWRTPQQHIKILKEQAEKEVKGE